MLFFYAHNTPNIPALIFRFFAPKVTFSKNRVIFVLFTTVIGTFEGGTEYIKYICIDEGAIHQP